MVDRFLLKSVQGHRISHEIFTELWMHIWEDRMSRPNSVFNEIQQIIEAHRDLKTNHFNLKNIQCPERMTQLLPKTTGSDVVSIQIQIADCSDMKNPKWRDAVTALVLEKGFVRWEIHNQYFPRGAGKHLAAEKMRSKCSIEHIDEKRIASLRCESIGQSRDNETHLVFSDLVFERDSDQLVVAHAKKYKNGQEACDDPKYCTVIKVPSQGAIEIIENVSRKSEEAVVSPASVE